MASPTIVEYLKYANLQMAAEAFIRNPDTGTLSATGQDLIDVLVDGNKHASKFTQIQAEAFAEQWQVVDQCPNTDTGFSGTLFRAIKDNPSAGIKKDELVLSIRSTEFIDDAARDCQATNLLELKEKGWAFGQIADMEKWYADLKAAGHLDASGGAPLPFTVTGYSLGAHLATAFNLLRREEVAAGTLAANPVERRTVGVRVDLFPAHRTDQSCVVVLVSITSKMRGMSSIAETVASSDLCRRRLALPPPSGGGGASRSRLRARRRCPLGPRPDAAQLSPGRLAPAE